MKATINTSSPNAYVVTLQPEKPDEQEAVRALSVALARPHIINSRGFQYMRTDVEFLVQPMPRGD